MSEAPKKKRPSGPSMILVAGTAVVLLALCFAVPNIGKWSAPQTEQTAAGATPTAAVCTARPVEWRDVTAPPNTAAKSAMIPIPDCHYIRFCDKKQDPECTAATFEGARFNVWCTTRDRDTELPLETSGDQAVNACRPQSKGSEPIKLGYAFIFSPPV